MAGIRYEVLHVQPLIPEGVTRLGRSLIKECLQLPVPPGNLHPLAPSASGGLQENRVPDFFRHPSCFDRIADQPRSRNHRDPHGPGHLPRNQFVAHFSDARGLRPDKNQVVFSAGIRKTRLLGQKSVSRVDRIGACTQGCRNNGLNL